MRHVLTILLTIAATPSLAEGARMVLDCDVATRCSQDGFCDEFDESESFVITPQDLDAQGAGAYTITFGENDLDHPARGLSRTGPWIWVPWDEVLFTLTLTGEDTAVWVRQAVGSDESSAPSASIDILTCDITG